MESQNTDLQVYSKGLHNKFTARVTQLRGHNHRAITEQIQNRYRVNTDQIENKAEQAEQTQSKEATEQSSHRAKKPQSRSGKQLQTRREQSSFRAIQGRASHTEQKLQNLRDTEPQDYRKVITETKSYR